MSSRSGTVFVLVNDAMPGFARLETTKKDDLAAKIRRLNKPALPVPWRLFFAAKVADCDLVERNIRYLFAGHCDDRDQAFYAIDPDELRAALELAATTLVELSDKDQGITPPDRVRMDELRASHEALRFKALGAAAGDPLYFRKDTSISCAALGNGYVQFDGEPLTPRQASSLALRKLGFAWSDVAGTDYWLTLPSPPPASTKKRAAPLDLEDEIADMPVVPNDADSSPVMFIRSRKP